MSNIYDAITAEELHSEATIVENVVQGMPGAPGPPGPPGPPGEKGDTGIAVVVSEEEPDDTSVIWIDPSEDNSGLHLGDLDDVDISTVSHGSTIVYDEISGKWVSSGGGKPWDNLVITKVSSEVLFTHEERIAQGLQWWPDGTMGFFYGAGLGLVSISANGPNFAVLIHNPDTSEILATFAPSIDLSGHIEEVDHASGGPVFNPWAYGGPTTVQPLIIYHGEDHESGSNWSFLGLAQTIPTGEIIDIGRIITPGSPKDSLVNHIDVMSGPFGFKDGYIYIYFHDSDDNGATVTNLSVARTTIDEMFQASVDHTVPVFYKYANGNWETPALGTLVAGDELIPNLGGYLAWCDFAYIEEVGAYMLVYSLAGAGVMSIHGRWTLDMVNFSEPFTLVEPAPEERWYVTLSSPLNASTSSLSGLYTKELLGGNVFDIYTTVSPEIGAARWEDLHVERVRFSILDFTEKLNQLEEQSVRYVKHGDNATVARPANAAMVIWRGSVPPDNMTTDDMFIEE